MYIYIWKTQDGTPFYVGLTKSLGRTNPKNNGNRNWLCTKKLEEIGHGNVIVEIRTMPDILSGRRLECKLIDEYGQISRNTGTLTNLQKGGNGTHSMSEEGRKRLSDAMKSPDHPAHSEKAREKQRLRMQDPEVRALFMGDNNPAKTAAVREKLKAKWQEEEYRLRQSAARTGAKKNFSEDRKAEFAERLKANPKMKGWSERNGIDSEFEAKRIAGIRAAQNRRKEKMTDPEALAQRKARLKETLNSEEYKARRAQWDTPEYREKLAEAKRQYWAKKRIEKLALRD